MEHQDQAQVHPVLRDEGPDKPDEDPVQPVVLDEVLVQTVLREEQDKRAVGHQDQAPVPPVLRDEGPDKPVLHDEDGQKIGKIVTTKSKKARGKKVKNDKKSDKKENLKWWIDRKYLLKKKNENTEKTDEKSNCDEEKKISKNSEEDESKSENHHLT